MSDRSKRSDHEQSGPVASPEQSEFQLKSIDNEAEDHVASVSSRFLENADTLIYTVVGILFLVSAAFALGYGVWDFINRIQDAIHGLKDATIATATIQFVSDLLLVLIIMEVLSTVIHYLKARATSLRPFLFIGIVSATRSILSIGARLSVEGKGIDTGEFQRAMIELGVSAAVVLALGITLKLLGNMLDTGASGK